MREADIVGHKSGGTATFAYWAALGVLIWASCHYSGQLQYSLLLFLFYGPQGLFVLAPLFPLGLALRRRQRLAVALALLAMAVLWAGPGDSL